MRPKKTKKTRFWKCGWREKSPPGWRQIYLFLIYLTQLFKYRLHLKNYSTALFFVEKHEVLPFIVQRKKRSIRLNKLLMENRLNGEFYD